MITPSFGLTATERVLPKLALDFTTASLDSRITFTRTTDATHPATYVNSSGIITAATNNQPRFDYDPVTLACKGLLIEESRTNLFSYSQDLTNAYWSKSGGAIDPSNLVDSPLGAATANIFKANAGTVSPYIYRTTGVGTVATGHVAQFLLKKGTHRYVQFWVNNQSTTYQNIDLEDGSLGDSAGLTGTTSMIPFADGWWLARFFYNCDSTNNRSPGIALIGSKTATRLQTFSAAGTETVFMTAFDCQIGAFATSYIPTTSAALTRNADVATMTGTNFSSWFNASEGAVYHEVTPIALTGQSAYSINNGTNNESIYSYDTSARYYYRIRTGAATQATISSPPGTAAVGTTTKCVTAYKINNFGISAQGQATSTALSGNIPTGINRLQIAPANNLYFRKLMYWPQRLINAEIQAFCK